jgi:hypothetical protein
MLEALYVVEFGDVAGSGFRNGGVAVLETNRIFGGDSGYYYLGTFTVTGGHIEAAVQIVKHNPAWGNAFGDAATSFAIRLSGAIGEDQIAGQMERLDMPGMRLPIRLVKKANLP